MSGQATRLAVSALAGLGGILLFTQMGSSTPTPTPRLKNQAFVFVKPHAVNANVNSLVRNELEAKGIAVTSEGEITAEQIDSKMLIDQHYYSIACKATLLKPEQMNIPADKFQTFFGVSFDDALKAKKVLNALDACKQLNLSNAEMSKVWAKAKKDNKLIKFGGGFYCGEITAKSGEKFYVTNAFYMSMRDEFVAAGKKIHYYTVEWDEDKLSWSDFRGKVLGPTDPKDAPASSLRGRVLRDWKALGLASEPNVGDNAVHASASPFEGMAERMNWLETPCAKDAFCTALTKAGISEEVVREWSKDPQVKIEDGKKKSLFDSLEDTDAAACLARAKALFALRK